MSRKNSLMIGSLGWLLALIVAILLLFRLKNHNEAVPISSLLFFSIVLVFHATRNLARLPRGLKKGCTYRYHGTTRQGNLMLTYYWPKLTPNPNRLNPPMAMVALGQYEEEDGVWNAGRVKLPSHLVPGSTYVVLRGEGDRLTFTPYIDPRFDQFERATPIIQQKQEWQKDSCLFCEKPAEFEAYAFIGGISSHIRCCEDKNCQEKAKTMASDG